MNLDIIRAHRLCGDVVDVERPPRRAHVERHDVLAGRKPSQIRDHNLDDEAAAGFEVSRDDAEAGHRRCLRRQIHDRVRDQVVLLAYGGPVSYVSAWLQRARQPDDRIFRLYVTLFVLDLMSEHGQAFNGNERRSTPGARAALRRAVERSLALARR